ncbi:MAG TPA: PAS domain-containing sensor histidine kinase [Anaeromyxobacter sp.]|nr:PAS domain-containing sensor histidine kinase [Anaeromyxobacter sp.]
MAEPGSLHDGPPAGDDLFRLMVECVTDYAIFALDPDGRVSTWNPGARRFKGWEAHEILGRHFSTFYPTEDVLAGKPARELEEAARLGRFEDEGWRVRKDGSRFWANVIITALRDGRGVLRGFGKVTRDLTARREREEAEQRAAADRAKAEEQARAAEALRRIEEAQRETIAELARAEREAREIGRLQERLMAIVGHDLRTPLSVIHLGITTALQRGGLAPDQERTLTRVARSAQRMRGIIEDLLDYSRARQGQGIPVAKAVVDLGEVCRRALAELRSIAGGRELVLSVTGDATLAADAGRLAQVISNLVGNAVQHGVGPIEVAVRTAPDDEVQLSVHNGGAPIPPEVLPQIFEPFRRGDRHGGDEKGSVGLGLFIVREVVRAHGGEVEVRSDASSGTTFTIRLPRGVSQAAAGASATMPG